MSRPNTDQLYAERNSVDALRTKLDARKAAINHILFPAFPAGHPRHAESIEKAWAEYAEAAPLTDAEIVALAELEARAGERGWRREPARILCAALRRVIGL